MVTRSVSALASVLIIGGLAAPSANATAAPDCWSPESWDRPGIERPHELYCKRTDAVELATGPEHGTLTALRFDSVSQLVRWRFRPDDDATAEDGFELRVSGPGGSTTQRVTVHVTPRAQNTPPLCEPASAAMRTDGNEPATIETHLYCWDYENDTFVLNGGGPGQHLDAPFTVEGGNGGGTGVPLWHYRTVTHDGEEATTFWATDDVGARSADTALTVKVGPSVDRLPECVPNPTYFDATQSYFPIYARPGATRRFGLICSDEDHDALSARLGTPPERGLLTLFELGPLLDWAGGSERWVDGVYVPGDATGEPDRFSVVATARGRTNETQLAIANADEPRWFNGMGCGYSTGDTPPGVPGVVRLTCSDDDGDPLAATVTRQPEHGIAAQPLITPGHYGWDDVAIAWTPEPGFTGLDTMDVRVADDHGLGVDVTVDLYVRIPPPSPPPPPELPPPGSPPTLPASGSPSVGQAPAVAPADQARAVLRTRAVVLVRRIGDARVYAARTAVRRGLVPRAGRAALAVTCPLTCRLGARVRAARGAARSSTRPGRALPVRLSRRAAALLRRTGSATFHLSVRMPAGRSGRGVVRLRRR